MIGIIVQLAISWLLAWLLEKKDLGVLGFRPTKKRVMDAGLFFTIAVICAASGYFMRTYFGERWILNPFFTWRLLAEGVWWNIKSVLYEELIFRGVILYILIKRVGVIWAIIISAVAFGIYHWFSFEIIGNVKQMIVVFIFTGAAGLLYAYVYTRTFSLYIPCVLHLGWNFTRNFIFSDGNIGNGALMMTRPDHTTTVSYFTYVVVIYFPMLAFLIISFFLLKKRKQIEPTIEGRGSQV